MKERSRIKCSHLPTIVCGDCLIMFVISLNLVLSLKYLNLYKVNDFKITTPRRQNTHIIDCIGCEKNWPPYVFINPLLKYILGILYSIFVSID